MVHVGQKLYFPQSSLAIDTIIKCITNLLNSYLFTSLRVHSSTEMQNQKKLDLSLKFMKNNY